MTTCLVFDFMQEAQKWSPISVGKCVNSLVWRGFEVVY